MAVNATYKGEVTVVRTVDDPFVGSGDNTVTINALNKTKSLTGATSATAGTEGPVTKDANFQKALSGGAGTIDFRALPTPEAGTIDLNGLKVQIVKFRNPNTNANPITIVEGASNGLALFGAAFSITLQPGQEIQAYLAEAAPDVSATDKTIDLTGTASQALDVQVVAG